MSSLVDPSRITMVSEPLGIRFSRVDRSRKEKGKEDLSGRAACSSGKSVAAGRVVLLDPDAHPCEAFGRRTQIKRKGIINQTLTID
jgi:hypothetical protein